MSQAWRVRAGKQALHAMRFHGGDFVALSWQEVPGSVAGMTKAEIRHVAEQHLPEGRAKVAAKQLYTFANEVEQGDLVLVPLKSRVDVLVGEVAGDYYYSETPLVAGDLYGHRMPVEWHGINDKRRLPDEILRSFDTRISLVRLPRADDARDLLHDGLRQEVAP